MLPLYSSNFRYWFRRMSLSLQKTPIEAFFELKEDPSSLLIDVRSDLELSNDGIVNLSEINREIIFKEWQTYALVGKAKVFFEELLEESEEKTLEQLFFICRSGIRSREAAEYCQSQFEEIKSNVICINILEGLEGDNNPNGRSGWKKVGLPWRNI